MTQGMGRKEALGDILNAPAHLLDALRDLLVCELAEAHSEMELADDEIAIWRAQGRTRQINNLLNLLNAGARKWK